MPRTSAPAGMLGGVVAAQPAVVAVFDCGGEQAETFDEVGEGSVVPGLAPAGSSSRSATKSDFDGEVQLLAPSPAGTYFYGACVDPVTDESDRTNNCSASVRVDVGEAAQPDLQVEAPDLQVGTPTVDNASPEAGATIMLSATVSNAGAQGSQATTLRFYRSTDPTITTTHTEVGNVDVRALTASGRSEGSISVTVPRTMGGYDYGACVDAVADESDTTNNCSAPARVMVVEPQQPEGVPSVRISSTGSAVTEGMAAQFGVTATLPPTADLDVYLSYVEYTTTEEGVIYRPWPPPETMVTITAGSSSTTLTVNTIDDSDADGNGALQVWVASGIGYTFDLNSFLVTVTIEDDD